MKILLAHAWRAGISLWAFWWVLAADAAEDLTAGESLTLARAIELTASHSPALMVLDSEVESLTSRSEAEALPPAFVIETDFENFAGTGSLAGVDSLETTVQLSRIIELGDKAGLRRGLGSAEIDRLAAEQRIRRVDFAAEVARRFIHVVSDQESLDAASRATELARTARDVVRERVEAGASSPAALSRTEIALARAQISQEHAEHALAGSRVKLSVLWGDAKAGFGEASGDLFELPALESLDAYRSRLDVSPDLVRFASEARVQEARIRLTEARRSPDISVGLGIRRLEAFDDQGLVASFSVPLGTRRRADLEERAARAERSRLDQELQAHRLDLQAALFDLYQEILHAQTEAQSLHNQIRPQAAAMLQTTNDGYRAGRFSLLELTDAQSQLLEVERDAIRAAAQFHTLLIELQRVTGEPIRTLGTRRSP